MAVVKGIREKVHLPLYDAKRFSSERTVGEIIGPGNLMKFFVDVQNKTRLETNQQESSVLSHYNTFEARALRVVVEPLLKLEDAGDNEAKQWKRDDEFVQEFIYNSVTSFIVGEKTMIQAPTWFFPSGAGPSNESGRTNGFPSPEATFRFAEPVQISHQQNFRVEIEFPRGLNVLPEEGNGQAAQGNGDAAKKREALAKKRGVGTVWVVLDGYITRDVQ